MKNLSYKEKKSSNTIIRIWTLLSLLISLPYVFILYFHKYFGIRDMWSFHISFHLLNYKDFGFVKRGIVGSLIKPIIPIIRIIPINFNLLILSIYIFCLVIFCLIYWTLAINSKTPILTKLALLTTPATFQFIGFNSPRTSELIWLILFGLWCLLFKKYKNYNYFYSALSGIIVSLSALTYEGSLIIISPIIFLSLALDSSKKSNKIKLINILIFLIPILVTTFLLFKHGNFEAGSEVIREILNKTSPNITDSLSEVIANNLIQTNINRIENNNLNWFSNNVIFILYFTTYLIAILKEIKKGDFKNYLLIFSSFSSILLCFVAVDFSRYIALSILVSSMILFLIKNEDNWRNSKIWIFFLLFGVMGPVGCAGMINPFPLWKLINDFLFIGI